MKVTLIQPAIGRVDGRVHKRRRVIEPLSIATLAGLTPRGVELRFFDERLEEIDFEVDTDLAGISTETLNVRRAYEIAAEYRKRGVPVVLGGVHPSLVPGEAQRCADAVLVGQAESVWGRLLEDARRRRLRKLYRGDATPVFGETFPDRSIYRGKNYLPTRLLEFGRGCVHHCDFCSVHRFFGQRYRTRSLESLRAEVACSAARNLLLVDDNVFSSRRAAEDICRVLAPLQVGWVAQASVSISDDDRLLDQLAASGCRGLLIGFESVNPGNLAQMGKRFNGGRERYRKAVGRIKARGIKIYGSFVVGYDHETRQTIDETVDFAIDAKLTIATFYPLTPFPGTGLYERLQRQKRLLKPRWWLDPQSRYGDIFFRPASMPAGELADLCVRARKKFYSAGSVLKRALDFHAHADDPASVLLYFLINLLVNRDIDLKNRTTLGFEP